MKKYRASDFGSSPPKIRVQHSQKTASRRELSCSLHQGNALANCAHSLSYPLFIEIARIGAFKARLFAHGVFAKVVAER